MDYGIQEYAIQQSWFDTIWDKSWISVIRSAISMIRRCINTVTRIVSSILTRVIVVTELSYPGVMNRMRRIQYVFVIPKRLQNRVFENLESVIQRFDGQNRRNCWLKFVQKRDFVNVWYMKFIRHYVVEIRQTFANRVFEKPTITFLALKQL